MDEEDGRPGALAAQTGHTDALSDVLTASLRNASSHPDQAQQRVESRPAVMATCFSIVSQFQNLHSALAVGWEPQVSLLRPGIKLHFSHPPSSHQEET